MKNDAGNHAFIEELRNCRFMTEFKGNNALHFRRNDFPEYFSSIISIFPDHIETRNVMHSEDMEPETIRFFHERDMEDPSQWIDEYLYFSDQIAGDDLTAGYRILESMKENREARQQFISTVMKTISRDPLALSEQARLSDIDLQDMPMTSRCRQIAENIRSMVHVISIPEIIDELKETDVIGAMSVDMDDLSLLAGKSPAPIRSDAVLSPV